MLSQNGQSASQLSITPYSCYFIIVELSARNSLTVTFDSYSSTVLVSLPLSLLLHLLHAFSIHSPTSSMLIPLRVLTMVVFSLTLFPVTLTIKCNAKANVIYIFPNLQSYYPSLYFLLPVYY